MARHDDLRCNRLGINLARFYAFFYYSSLHPLTCSSVCGNLGDLKNWGTSHAITID